MVVAGGPVLLKLPSQVTLGFLRTLEAYNLQHACVIIYHLQQTPACMRRDAPGHCMSQHVERAPCFERKESKLHNLALSHSTCINSKSIPRKYQVWRTRLLGHARVTSCCSKLHIRVWIPLALWFCSPFDIRLLPRQSKLFPLLSQQTSQRATLTTYASYLCTMSTPASALHPSLLLLLLPYLPQPLA
jgi:hypothetical protein